MFIHVRQSGLSFLRCIRLLFAQPRLIFLNSSFRKYVLHEFGGFLMPEDEEAARFWRRIDLLSS